MQDHQYFPNDRRRIEKPRNLSNLQAVRWAATVKNHLHNNHADAVPCFLCDFRSDRDVLYGRGVIIYQYYALWAYADTWIPENGQPNTAHLMNLISPEGRAGLERVAPNSWLYIDGANCILEDAEGLTIDDGDLRKGAHRVLRRPSPPKHTEFHDDGYSRCRYNKPRLDPSGHHAVRSPLYHRHNGAPPNATHLLNDLLNRRGCKYLLWYLTRQRMNGDLSVTTVRYVLDGIDRLSLVDGALVNLRAHDLPAKLPVCTSEIRALFRGWAYYKPYIQFYDCFEPCPPPWDTDDDRILLGWGDYARGLLAKHRPGGAQREDEKIPQDNGLARGRDRADIQQWTTSAPSEAYPSNLDLP